MRDSSEENGQRSPELERLESVVAPSQSIIELSSDVKSLWDESPTRAAGCRQTLKIGDVEYGFCWIPAGEFDMGSPKSEQREADANMYIDYFWDFSEEALHHVKLTKGFWLLETPMPQSLYEEVMGTNPSKFKGDNLPVENVSWYDATEFCEELTKRLPKWLKATLPTEAQWEYGCRAGTTTPYSFGNALNGDDANCAGDYPFGTKTKGKYVGQTTPVKSYRPNPWGLYDMHGNVDEWTSDYYDDYPSGTAIDPKGPTFGSDRRVFRGGHWYNPALYCRSARRGGVSADYRGHGNQGFRFLLVCD